MKLACVVITLLFFTIGGFNTNAQTIDARKNVISVNKVSQQRIDSLLEKLNNWVLDKSGVFDVDAYERPYAHQGYISSGETGGWISSLKNQLYQLGATVVWNENKKLYELENNRHLIARRQFVAVYIDKTLYQSEKAPGEHFLKFSIKNTGKRTIGFNLSHPNNIFYANQWGKYNQPYRGEIDESRVIFKQEDLVSLKAEYKEGALKMIKSNGQLDYFVNLDGNTDNMALADKNGFFIVTIDGQMKFTDGKEIELITLEKSDDEQQRSVVFPLPINAKFIAGKQMIFVNKVVTENTH
jgi:hypothetical protein